MQIIRCKTPILPSLTRFKEWKKQLEKLKVSKTEEFLAIKAAVQLSVSLVHLVDFCRAFKMNVRHTTIIVFLVVLTVAIVASLGEFGEFEYLIR